MKTSLPIGTVPLPDRSALRIRDSNQYQKRTVDVRGFIETRSNHGTTSITNKYLSLTWPIN
eukprot:9793716-Prorocentrum_lima.AAC.1